VKEITVRQALNDAMREEMHRDDKVILLGCDVAIRGNPFGVTRGLCQEFGEKRVIDTPISGSQGSESVPQGWDCGQLSKYCIRTG
jgi:pyruvate/2-oxoglutarate/acetoin dehydrogenase E1 component